VSLRPPDKAPIDRTKRTARRSPAQIEAALIVLGLEAASVEAVHTGAPVWATARTYRVTASDGAQWKLRFGQGTRLAARSAGFLEALDGVRIPAPRRRVGRLSAEAWVPGSDLGAVLPGPAALEAAADLFATLHCYRGAHRSDRPSSRSTAPMIRRCLAMVEDLLGWDVLPSPSAQALSALLTRALPARSRWGLTHGDFCGENLVARPDGSLVLIDNERLCRGLLEADVGRVWYRWPLDEQAWERFEARYREETATDALPVDERWAWRTTGALRGLHVRARRQRRAERAVSALNDVLAAIGGPRLAVDSRP
jgi:aminoglycoside phosphotransferase (APT) family kinase protein